MRYTADTEAMQAYSRIVGAIAQLDLQRQELVRQLQLWEQEHQVPEAEEQPENQPKTD